MPERFLRQLDIVKPEELNIPITIIGAGATGSAITLNLAMMGCRDISVYDGDKLEEHNIPNQICIKSMIGQDKVRSLRVISQVHTGTEIHIGNWNRRSIGKYRKGIVIFCVDTMKTRQKLWKTVHDGIDLLIDPRMGAEVGHIHVVYPKLKSSRDVYETTLADDAEPLPCSARSIIYAPSILAGFVASIVKRYVKNQEIPMSMYIDIPNGIIVKD